MKTCLIRPKKAISKERTLLNEIFTLDDSENEIKMAEYANNLDIKIM